jgi:hypothetical protein
MAPESRNGGVTKDVNCLEMASETLSYSNELSWQRIWDIGISMVKTSEETKRQY